MLGVCAAAPLLERTTLGLVIGSYFLVFALYFLVGPFPLIGAEALARCLQNDSTDSDTRSLFARLDSNSLIYKNRQLKQTLFRDKGKGKTLQSAITKT